MSNAGIQFTKRADVCQRAASGRATLYAREAAGTFAQSVKIGPRASAFIEHEVQAVLAAQALGATDNDLRELVRELVRLRAEGQPFTLREVNAVIAARRAGADDAHVSALVRELVAARGAQSSKVA